MADPYASYVADGWQPRLVVRAGEGTPLAVVAACPIVAGNKGVWEATLRRRARRAAVASVEDQFQDIAEETEAKAGAVDCTTEEYVEGLKTIIGQLKSAMSAAEEDLEDD